MKVLLPVVLFALGGDAACVWLRNTESGGLAWCVDKTTAEEGEFYFKLEKSVKSTMNPIQLHKAINSLYEKAKREERRRTGSPLSFNQSEDDTIYSLDIPGSFWGGINYAALDAINDAFTKGMDLLTPNDDRLPMSTCMLWEGDECTSRADRNIFEMTQAQIFAIDDEVKAVCIALGMHAASGYVKATDVIQRRCCSCAIGETH